MLVQLLLAPLPQLVHQRPTAGLMMDQPLEIAHPGSARLLVIAINSAQRLKHILAFRRKVGRHFHIVPAAMRQTVAAERAG